MKKIAVLILGMVVSSFMFPADIHAAGAVLNVSGGGDHKLKTTFNVAITLNTGGEKVCVVGFDMTYPADILTLSGTPTFGSDSIMSVEKDVSTPGKLHYLLGMTGCPAANSTLVTAKFTSAKTGSGSLGFSAIEAFGGENGEASIGITGSSASVSVSKATVAYTPPKTPEPVQPTAASLPVAPASPVASKVEFSPDAVLDNVEKKTKGIILSGTTEVGSTVSFVSGDSEIGPNVVFEVSEGLWSLTLDSWISDGVHTFTIVSEKGGVKSSEVTVDFITGSRHRSQIALGTVLPVFDCTLDNSCLQSKKSVSVLGKSFGLDQILIIGGSILVLLVVILIIVFGVKRKKHLNFANRLSQNLSNNSNFFSVEDKLQNPVKGPESSNAPEMSQQKVEPLSQESFRLPTQESIEIIDNPEISKGVQNYQSPQIQINPEPKETPEALNQQPAVIPQPAISEQPKIQNEQKVESPEKVEPTVVNSSPTQTSSSSNNSNFWAQDNASDRFHEDSNQEGFCAMQNFKPEHTTGFNLMGHAPSGLANFVQSKPQDTPTEPAPQTPMSNQNDMMESISINLEGPQTQSLNNQSQNQTINSSIYDLPSNQTIQATIPTPQTVIPTPQTVIPTPQATVPIPQPTIPAFPESKQTEPVIPTNDFNTEKKYKQDVPVFDPYFTIDN